MTPAKAAQEVGRLFPAIYLRLQQRRTRLDRASAQTLAMLQHMAQTGPITVGEAAKHFARAQSAISEMFARLARRKLIATIRDERDRRRALVWLTDEGHALLARAGQVLSDDGLCAALSRMSASDRNNLVTGMRALVAAANPKEKR
jgi:DNA-binding MarR family transcriptional regulator